MARDATGFAKVITMRITVNARSGGIVKMVSMKAEVPRQQSTVDVRLVLRRAAATPSLLAHVQTVIQHRIHRVPIV